MSAILCRQKFVITKHPRGENELASSASHPYGGFLLQAEVAPGQQAAFENRYLAATAVAVSPGNPPDYQAQHNKWGAELRIYFNDAHHAAALSGAGVHVEQGRGGYLSGSYLYRVNNNDLWWELVEIHGLRLGSN